MLDISQHNPFQIGEASRDRGFDPSSKDITPATQAAAKSPRPEDVENPRKANENPWFPYTNHLDMGGVPHLC